MPSSSATLTCFVFCISCFVLLDVLPLYTVAVSHWKLQHGDIIESLDSPLLFLKDSDPLFAVLVDSLPSTEEDTALETTSYGPPDEDFRGGSTTLFMNKDADSEFDGKFPTLPLEKSSLNASVGARNALQVSSEEKIVLSCGVFANVTDIDHLEGMRMRARHGYFPEPELELLFTRKVNEPANFKSIEQTFIQAVKENENTPVLFNLVGNFLRMQGNTYYAIECYRNVLEQSPGNLDAYLNLARVMIVLGYYEDAMVIVKRSIQRETQSAWLQHYVLSQIYTKLGKIETAIVSMEYAVKHKPGFAPAQRELARLIESRDGKAGSVVLLVVLVIVISAMATLYYRLTRGNDFRLKDDIMSLISSSYSTKEEMW